ncbi:DUF3352 domain-containing protein [Phormidium sp. CCY1219]|uniref:DUF3352 domain-containing protein n=1 Tax=Phormidium sp. CCY1219 TaxID=2886104 RepID=UPI002D1F1FFB|nr:DUF3352 domain-containing protein [Phormidium sp. CCY1219]MEB3831583.1 DUF3352 domain-containing protein [Phormidium sp. CCY1219]
MFSRKNPSRLVIAAIAAAGVAFGYFYLRGTFSWKSEPLESAKVIPDEAVMAAYFITDSQRWSKFQQFGTPAARGAIARRLQNLETQLLSQHNLDYETDLQPWVGNITLAWVPSTTTSEAPLISQPNYLMVVEIKNKLRAWLFARNFKSKQDVKRQVFNYKGVELAEIISPMGTPLYQTMLENKLLLSGNRSTLETAIDTHLGEPSFASIPAAAKQLASGENAGDAIANFYIPDYSEGIKQLQRQIGDRTSVVSPIQTVKSASIAVGVEDVGLRVRVRTEIDPQWFESQPAAAGQILDRFPAETLAFVSGENLANSWTALVAQTEVQPELAGAVTLIRQAFAAANLNADRDIFRWIDGEFAAGLISSQQGLLGQLGFGGVVVLETSDRATAEATLAKLDAIGRNLLPFPVSISSRTVNGVLVREWKIPMQGALLGHGWLDDDSLFLAIGGPMVDAIATPPTASIQENPNFRAIADSLPNPNQGYFYLEMEKFLNAFNALPLFVGTQIPPETQAMLNSIRGIGVTGTWSDPTQYETHMLFSLKKTKELTNP